MKNLALLGSTGSIGRQCLEVVDSQSDINVVALSIKLFATFSNIKSPSLCQSSKSE